MPVDTPLNAEALRDAADRACRLLKTLSNPDRLVLLCHLAEGEKRVGELEALAGVPQPTLSQQLGVLREEGLVRTRRDGKHIYYRFDDPQPLAVMKTLYQQFCATPMEKNR